MSDQNESNATSQLILKELQELNSKLGRIRRKPFKMHMTMQVFVAVVAANLTTVFLLWVGFAALGLVMLRACDEAGGAMLEDLGAYMEEEQRRMERELEAEQSQPPAIEPAEPKSLQDWADEQP